MLNLDTHIFLYAVTDQLKTTEAKLLRGDQWSISAICLWEISKLSQLGRIEVDLDDPQVVRTLRSVRVWPITVEIAKRSTRLDITGDPADELIAATSVVHKVPLVTRDRNLRRSRIVPLLT
ncbi:MAG: type II toxin-antitoxin system VapC family toxin [Actinomycetota bacterium]